MAIKVIISDMAVIMSQLPSQLRKVGQYKLKIRKTPQQMRSQKQRLQNKGVSRPKVNPVRYETKNVIAQLQDGTYAFRIGLWPRMQQAMKDGNFAYEVTDNRDPQLKPQPDMTAFQGFAFRQGQDQAIAHILTDDTGIIQCPTGWGKCHSPNTRILMHNGEYKLIANIVQGDQVRGVDGKPRTVTNVTRGHSNCMHLFQTQFIKSARALTQQHYIIVCTICPYGISLNGRNIRQYQTFALSVEQYLTLGRKQRSQLRMISPHYATRAAIDTRQAYIMGFIMAGSMDTTTAAPNIIKLNKKAAKIVGSNRTIALDMFRQGLLCDSHTGQVTLSDTSKAAAYRHLDMFHKALHQLVSDCHIIDLKRCQSYFIEQLLKGGYDITDAFLSGMCDAAGLKRLTFCNDIEQILHMLMLVNMRYSVNTLSGCLNLNKGSVRLRHTKRYAKLNHQSRQQEKAQLVKFKIYQHTIQSDYVGIQVDKDHLYLLEQHVVTHNSTVIGKICRMYPQLNIVVATSSSQVMKTLYNNIIKQCPGEVGIICSGQDTSNGKRIVVSTLKSLAKVNPQKVHLLLIDQAHGIGDNVAGAVVAQFIFGRRFGFTATPVRNDGSSRVLQQLLGPVIMTVSYEDAVSNNMVVPLKYVMLPCNRGPSFLRDVPDGSGKLVRKALPQDLRKRFSYWRNFYRNNVLAEAVKRILAQLPDMQILVMVQTLQHAIALHQFLPNFLVAYYGATSKQAVKEAIEKAGVTNRRPQDYLMKPKQLDRIRGAFQKGTLKRVISTTTFRQGVDFKQLAIIVRADGRISFIDCIQIPGRAARTAQGKQTGYIIDVWDTQDHWAKQRAETRQKHYKDQQWQKITLQELINELKNTYAPSSETPIRRLPSQYTAVEDRQSAGPIQESPDA